MSKYKKEIESFLKNSDEKEEELEQNKKEVLEEVQDIQEYPVDDVFGESTPNEYFESELGDEQTSISDNVDNIIKYIDKKSDALSNFDIDILSFKYKIFDKVKEDFKNNVKVDSDEFKDFLSSSAIIPVLVQIKILTDDEVEENVKNGMIIFSVVGDEVITNDIVKAQDGQTHSLTNEGLSSLFYY